MEKYKEIFAYIFWGVMTTAVSWGSYSMIAVLLRQYSSTLHILGLHVPAVVFAANSISWICAVSFAFVANKMWVFDSRCWKASVALPELGKFVAARLATGILEIVGVPLFVGSGLDQSLLGIEGAVAKVVVSLLVQVLNYVFSKLLIFRKR